MLVVNSFVGRNFLLIISVSFFRTFLALESRTDYFDLETCTIKFVMSNYYIVN